MPCILQTGYIIHTATNSLVILKNDIDLSEFFQKGLYKSQLQNLYRKTKEVVTFTMV